MGERYDIEPPAGTEGLPAVAQWAERWMTRVAGLILIGTMTMTAIDVFGRYLFSAPLGFAYEMTELAMAVMFFIALAAVTLRAEHISVGLFDAMFTGRLAHVREIVIAAFLMVGIGFLCWRMYLFANRIEDYGDTTNVLKIAIYPFCYLGTFGLGLAALSAAVRVLEAVRRLVRGSA